MPADRAVNWAVIHAGPAADAAQNLAHAAAQKLRAPVVDEDHVALLRPVGIAVATRAGNERRIRGNLLARGRARQEPQQDPRVIERRHHLLDRGHHDVHARQRQRQVGVALVRHDDGRAGLGDEQVGSRDADVGGQEFRAQDAAGFRDEDRRARGIAVGRQVIVVAQEVLGDVGRAQVDHRRDEVARRLAAELDDVLAEVGLDHLQPACLEPGVEADLLRHHRLALGHEAARRSSRQMPRTMSQASAAVDAQCTFEPAAVALRSNSSR